MMIHALHTYDILEAPAQPAPAAPATLSTAWTFTDYFMLTGTVLGVIGVALTFFAQIPVYAGVLFAATALSSGYGLYVARKFLAISQMDASYQRAQQTVSQLEATVKKMSDDNGVLARDIDLFKKENVVLKESTKKAEQVGVQLREVVQRLERQNVESEQARAALTRNLADAQQQNAALSQIREQLERSITAFLADGQTFEQRVTQFQNLVQAVGQESAAIGTHLSNSNQNFRTVLHRFSAALLQNDLASRRQITALTEQTNALHAGINRLTAERTQIQALASQLDEKNRVIALQEERLTQDRTQLRGTVEQFSHEKEAFAEQVRILHQERENIEHAKLELDTATQHMAQVQVNVETLIAQYNAVISKLEKKNQEFDAKRAQQQQAEQVVSRAAALTRGISTAAREKIRANKTERTAAKIFASLAQVEAGKQRIVGLLSGARPSFVDVVGAAMGAAARPIRRASANPSLPSLPEITAGAS
jgi:chromosome segregation ATPase